MKEDLSPELRSFIENYLCENKFRNIDLSNLNLNTSLDLDLNLFDLEMDLFMTAFIKKFNIHYEYFDWRKYGYPRGSWLILVIRSFFNYKKNWVKKLATDVYKPRITARTLQDAITSGSLV